MSAALQATGLRKGFGGVVATNDVTLTLAPGARHALIGPNGAGKTTLVNQLAGVIRPDAGRILLDGRDVTRMGVARRARLGLGRTFQINQMFPTLTPAEAVALAVGQHLGRGGDPWRGPGASAAVVARTAELIDRFGLGEAMDRPARELSYGQQRLLEIAIALAARPRVLLLDEPAAGIAEAERAGLIATLAALPPEVSILLIEHDMDLVFFFAERISVMVNGAIFAEGAPAEIMADPRVRAVYLGGEADG